MKYIKTIEQLNEGKLNIQNTYKGELEVEDIFGDELYTVNLGHTSVLLTKELKKQLNGKLDKLIGKTKEWNVIVWDHRATKPSDRFKVSNLKDS